MTEKTDAVQRMQDYIEAHLTEKITLADLAQAACFSPWYSARIFKELTGLAPADYIRRMRLSKSALRLRDEKCRVLDVAYDMGFVSVDGYQRAFRREFGCNPNSFAKNPVPLSLFIAYGVKFKEFWKESCEMNEVKSVFLQVTDRPARKAVIKRGIKAEEYWTYCKEVGCDVWGILTSMKSLSGEPVCMWLPEHLRKAGTSVYVQGVETCLDFDGVVPEGFDVIELPASQYLMLQGEPFAEEDYCGAIEELQAAAKRYDPTVIGYEWDNESPRIQLEPVGSRGYIELYPVKKK